MLFLKRISERERADTAKNLAIMLKSGITIDEAMTVLAEQRISPGLKAALIRVRTDIQNGTTLGSAFEKEQAIFGAVFVNLLRAGESSGSLEKNLHSASQWIEQSEDVRREVRAAIMYPKLVFSAAILLGAALAVFILPKLVPLFSGLKVELPLATRVLMWLSAFIEHYWIWCAVVATLLYGGIHFLYRKVFFLRRFMHGVTIKMPFFGVFFQNYQLAMAMELCAVLLKSGFQITEALDLSAASISNISYQSALRRISERITKGTTLGSALAEEKALFPGIVASIIAVGEASGTMREACEYLGEHYVKEVRAQAKKLPTVIEPVLLLCIALVVGFVALAIITPIYSLTGNIAN